MDPSKPDQDPNTSMKDWFNSVPTDASAASTIVPETISPEKPPRRSKKRLKITLLLIGISLLIAIGAAYLLMKPPQTAKACLNTNAYEDFTGSSAPASFSPKTLFYAASIDYTNGTATPVDRPVHDKTTDKIGRFYDKYAATSSIHITLTSDYYDKTADTKSAAQNRLDSLKQALESRGVSSSAVTITPPKLIDDTDELAADSPSMQQSAVYIMITSKPSCQTD